MNPATPAERRTAALALPPVPEPDARLIAAFLDSIWAENGLAKLSLAGYRRDLEGLARWRNGRGGLAAADRSGLFDYFASRTGQGYAPRSNARLLSSLRAFYAPLRPLQIPFWRSGKHHKYPGNICPVLRYDLISSNHISLGLRHFGSMANYHALG